MTCRRTTTRCLRAALALAGALVLTAHAATEVPVLDNAPIVAVPPVVYRGPTVARTTELASPAGTPARRIDLPSPRDAEAAGMRAYNQASDVKGQPLAIGFGRELPPSARDIPLASLEWTPDAGGGRSARIEIASPGAAALRVALSLDGAPAGLAFRFAGSAAGAPAFGPFAAREASSSGERLYWSPALAGDTATIEISADPDVALDGLTLHVPRVSHVLVDGAGTRSLSELVLKATGIGASGACNVDVACVAATNAPAVNFAKSVAKITFVSDSGRTFLCTGTLIADSVQSQTPYLFAASHCLDSASVARTLNTYWFYDAATCNSNATPPYVQLIGGAALLARSPDHDWSLVKLNDVPPAGTQFAAWRAEALADGTAVATVHHPAGDLGKISTGKVTGDFLLDVEGVNAFFTEVTWSKGVTEGGSSGSALVTLAPGGGWYELRGGLFAGSSACSAQSAPDYFSHLDAALPQIRQYLTPNAVNAQGVVPAVEFYNRTLDHYFLSTNPVEIANLDSGKTVGWVRTGLRFLVYDNPQPGASPVCRFYRAPAYGDSHFYSASPDECAATAAAHPVDWIYESPNVFYVPLPDKATGACPNGTQSVYRYFNAATTNHRYTQELTVRDDMDASSLWIAEGYGPGPYYPIMCALKSQ